MWNVNFISYLTFLHNVFESLAMYLTFFHCLGLKVIFLLFQVPWLTINYLFVGYFLARVWAIVPQISRWIASFIDADISTEVVTYILKVVWCWSELWALHTWSKLLHMDPPNKRTRFDKPGENIFCFTLCMRVCELWEFLK